MRRKSLAVCHGMEHPHILPLLKEAGFDGFFSDPMFGNNLPVLQTQAAQLKELGLDYDNSHATIPGAELLWEDCPEAERVLKNLLLCVDNCAAVNTHMLVVHCSPEAHADFSVGIRRMEKLVDYAEKKRIQIAFENTCDEKFLVKTLRHFEGCGSVGFCYDSGHEAFCTPGVRFLPQIGDRLIYTHFCDNYLDGDHHLLPWDGKIDFDRVMGELRDTGYAGTLCLEVSYVPYEKVLSPLEYVKKCYDVTCRLEEQLDR